MPCGDFLDPDGLREIQEVDAAAKPRGAEDPKLKAALDAMGKIEPLIIGPHYPAILPPAEGPHCWESNFAVRGDNG